MSIPYYPEIEPCSYGHNHIIRQYISWPDNIPLPISIPHYYFAPDNVLNNRWIRRKHEKEAIIKVGIFPKEGLHVCGDPILYMDSINYEKKKNRNPLSSEAPFDWTSNSKCLIRYFL